MTYPNRDCTQGGRLHRTASLRHSQSTISASSTQDQRAHQYQAAHQIQPAHQDQVIQQTQQGLQDLEMARFGVPDQDHPNTSPNPTPLINDSSAFSLNNIRSTPCPGRGLYPQGPLTLPDNDSMLRSRSNADDVFGPGTVVPDSMGPPAFRLERARVQQRSRLRESLATLREALVNSTALVNSLRMRNEVFRAENAVKEEQLKEAREGAGVVEHVMEKEKPMRVIVVVVATVVLLGVGCAYWCWCMGPEMQYVLRRRREVLGL